MICNSGNCQQISDDIISIRDAVIVDLLVDRRNSIVTITYVVQENRRPLEQVLSLIVSSTTVIRNQRGQIIPVIALQIGMVVNVVTSAVTTKSIPPQSRTFVITVVQSQQGPSQPPGPPRPPQRPGRGPR